MLTLPSIMVNSTAITVQKRPSGPAPYRNQATQRVLTVLLALSDAPQPRGVSGLARTLGMNKNMVHRALSTLIAAGYATRDAAGELYQPGPRCLALTPDNGSDADIIALARPILERLHALTGARVYVSVIVGRTRVTVDDIQAEGTRVLRSRRGAPVPLHCTKMSRVLLAQLTDEEIAEYLRA